MFTLQVAGPGPPRDATGPNMTHLAGKRNPYPPLGPPASTPFGSPLGTPLSTPLSLSRLDTPLPLPLPVLGHRRSSLLAGAPLGSLPLGALGGSTRDSNSLPSFYRRGVSKRRSSSSREDVTKHPKPPTPDLPVQSGPRPTSPAAPPRSSALFSPYSPLPAIGTPSASMRSGSLGHSQGSQGEADTDTDADDKSLGSLERPPRLLRERTYDVLEPRFVRGPAQGLEGGPGAGQADNPWGGALLRVALEPAGGTTRPSLPAALTPAAMIEDEELPTSPPAMDDEDFDCELVATRGTGLDGDPAGVTVEDPGEHSRGSRSLQALKEGYKGKLRKFWSKF